jgi:hypothetical protein
VWHWRLSDERIGGATSAAHAVEEAGRVVVIDPLPLVAEKLERLGPITAVCLTARYHQQSAWRYRLCSAPKVWAPETRPMEEEPAKRRAGDVLPAACASSARPEGALLLPLARERRLFCSDLVMEGSGDLGSCAEVPPTLPAPPVGRNSSASPSVLCLDHGAPSQTSQGGAPRPCRTTA